MAFVQVETWPADAFQRIGTAPRSPKLWPWSGLMANGRDVNARRAAAVALSLAIHIGAIWSALDKLATGIGDGGGQGRGDEIVMIDLSGMQSTGNAPSPDTGAAPQATPTPAVSPVEASAPSDVFKPEWTVSKLRIATAQPMNTAAAPSAAVGPNIGQVGSGAAGAGGQGYDPYAGASPQRLDPNVATATGGSGQAPGLGTRVMGRLGFGTGSGPPVLDRQAFEEAAQAIKRALPRGRGRLEIAVRVSSTGVILDARISDSTLDVGEVKQVRSVLIGRKLFNAHVSANDTQWLILPEMILNLSSTEYLHRQNSLRCASKSLTPICRSRKSA